MLICPIDSDLLDRCSRLYVEAVPSAGEGEKLTLDHAHSKLARMYRDPGFLGLVAAEGSEIVGFAVGHVRDWIAGKRYELSDLVVTASRRGFAAAVTLVDALHEELDRQGIETPLVAADPGCNAA